MKLFAAKPKNRMQNEAVELSSLKVLFGIYAFFIIASIVMPQYFGIHIGVDITCARMSNLLFIAYVILNQKICTHFLQTAIRCEILIPIGCYLLVAAYTMVLRVNINAFFLVFFEMFSLFMMIYGIRYVVGCKRAINWVIGCAYFLSFYGLFEFVYGKSLFLQIFRTLPTAVGNAYRSGQYRIMGPCGHALGYGLLLLLFVAIACIDLEKNEVYLFKRPVLLATLFLNVFLTGSRSTLGLVILEFVIILAFSTRRNVLKSLFFGVILVLCLALFLLVFGRTEIGNYLLGQIASVIDQVFDTSYATNFGIEVQRLEDSENYRAALPYIFKLDWLNPLVGRGTADGFGAEINGVFIHSIDNYYVAQYIKFAYPGMIAYILFIVTIFVILIRDIINRGSAVTKMVFTGVVIYFINLWWVDALQTLKFVYIFIAIFYASYLESKDKTVLKK
ncbi:MAG: hypothetical protein IKL28_07880 [Lachnospiraceae bacterium]|nr:hypothetical protein [Lachnospiraceae bacterium]